jgi:TolA-binding protein
MKLNMILIPFFVLAILTASAQDGAITGRIQTVEGQLRQLKESPESFSPEGLARLGVAAWQQARDLALKAEELQRSDNPKNREKAEEMLDERRRFFDTVGTAFTTLVKRFPKHELAGWAQNFAGHAFLQAQDYAKAIQVFQTIVDTHSDDKSAAEGLYWLGYCHVANGSLTNGIRVWKRLVQQYPESNWAKDLSRSFDPKGFEPRDWWTPEEIERWEKATGQLFPGKMSGQFSDQPTGSNATLRTGI